MSAAVSMNGQMTWSETLPSHWSLRKLKSFADVRFSNVDKHSSEGEQPVRLCNYTDVYYQSEITADIDFMQATATPAEAAKFALHAGDVLITKDSEIATDIAVPAFVPADLPGVICGYHLAQVRPRTNEINGKFLHYAFSAHGIRDQFHLAANGITRYGLSQHDIKSALFPIPPRHEQDALVALLDAKLAEIDRFIDRKQRSIELLEEERQRAISEVVTRGVDTSIRLKDSQVRWLPKIPQRWTMRRNGTLFDERKQRGRAELPVLMVSINTGVTVDRPNEVREQKQIDDKEKYAFAAQGDIAFNMMRMWQGAVGVAPVDGNVSPAYIVCRPRPEVCAEYYELLFRTRLYQGEVFCHSYGIVPDRNRLYWIGFKSIHSPYPPYAEQREIVAQVRQMGTEIEAVKQKTLREIDLINELRGALIAEAITGKIDVRSKS